MARVPKMLPNRTVSDKGRVIWDATPINQACHKSRHPPALQPKHREVARAILWWRLRMPGIPILLSKKDVSEAFKWIPVALEDTRFFAADLPASYAGTEHDVTLVYGYLTFGWCGAPGEYMGFAWLLKLAHQAFGPEDPKWEDTDVAFHSFVLMDDQVLIEPDIGCRPWTSVQTAEEATRAALGPDSINPEKDQEEGQMETRKLIWGLLYDTERNTRSLPPVKLEKAFYLLHLPCFDYGERKVPLKMVQELRGNQQFWLEVLPCLAPYLGATNELLGPPDENGFAVARGENPDQVWQRFWETIELQRLLVDDQRVWEERFTASLVGALTITEFLSFPGLHDQVVWASGDATTKALGAIDWTARVAVVESAWDLWSPLETFLAESRDAGTPLDACSEARFAPGGEVQEEVMIAIAELLAVLGLVAACWKSWAGNYAGDNQNVISWLQHRSAGPAAARYLLQILGAAEAVGGFRLHGEYIRTYHNRAADDLTRLDPTSVLRENGLTRVRALEPLREMLDRGWLRRALVWGNMGEADKSAALQLGTKRSPPAAVPLGPRQPLKAKVLEVVSGPPVYSRELSRQGAEARHVQLGPAQWSGPTASVSAVEAADLVCGSLGRGTGNVWDLVNLALSASPRSLIFDGLNREGPRGVMKLLPPEWQTRILLVSGRSLSDQVWWRRWVLVATRGSDVPEFVISIEKEPCTPPLRAYNLEWLDPKVVAERQVKEGILKLDSSMPHLKSATPKPCGSVETFKGGDVSRRLIWDPTKPLPHLHFKSWDHSAPDSLLLLGSSKAGPVARVLDPLEAVRLLGGRVELLPAEPPADLASQLLLATPPSLAAAAGPWLENVLAEGDLIEPADTSEDRFDPGLSPRHSSRAGVCHLPWEEHTLSALLEWLQERGYPEDPPTRTGAHPKMGGKKKEKGKGKGKALEDQLDHALTRHLRHEGFGSYSMSEQGWVKLEEVVRYFNEEHHLGRKLTTSASLVPDLVAQNNKQRMVLRVDEQGQEAIAAWSGHTLEGVVGPAVLVASGSLPKVLVHGTYQRHVPSIQSKGIVPGRRAIHLQNPEATSGRWRVDLEVQIRVDVDEARRQGCSFRLTGNLVWLCSEVIPPQAIIGVSTWDLRPNVAKSEGPPIEGASPGTPRLEPGRPAITQGTSRSIRVEAKPAPSRRKPATCKSTPRRASRPGKTSQRPRKRKGKIARLKKRNSKEVPPLCR